MVHLRTNHQRGTLASVTQNVRPGGGAAAGARRRCASPLADGARRRVDLCPAKAVCNEEYKMGGGGLRYEGPSIVA
jgi:hypothetical protein